MKFMFDDGGRAAAGYKGNAGDCGARALAIATGIPYQQAYEAINEIAKTERKGKRKSRGPSNARTGVYSATMRRLLASMGWNWTPTMHIGSGCKVHLHDGELPMGRLLVRLSKHYTTVIDGVIHDTFDPQRETYCVQPGSNGSSADADSKHWIERRCVYGYWSKA